MTQADETTLLRQYRAEAVAVRRQIKELLQRRDALVQVITGLESILRINGIDPDQIDEPEALPSAETEASAVARTSDDEPPPSALLSAVIAALESANTPMGAKELHTILLRRGIAANYYTLYKNLDRESKRVGGLIRRVKDKFGLRRWAINDTGA